MTDRTLKPASRIIRDYWFLMALVAIAVITMADRQEWTVGPGRWLKAHGGPNLVIFFIFFFSGLTLDGRLLRKGLVDLRSTLAALALIFVFSPVVALLFHLLPLDVQIITGLFLVAVMPSTLSSGVVMTASAGGNSAHALFVTILANTLAVFTIPLVLGLLLAFTGNAQTIAIDKGAIMLKIAVLVLLPLALGAGLQSIPAQWCAPVQRHAPMANQLLILFIVWMGMCQSRMAILSGGTAILPITAVCFGFHLLLVLLGLLFTRFIGIGPGRRESVIFMGGQKTLPLSVILQVSLFPSYGLALVVCVMHHVIHLIMDAYLVGKLKNKAR